MKITCPNCRARLVVTSPGELRTPHCAPRRNVPDPLEGASLPLPAETIAGDTGESGAVARLPKSVPHPLTTPAEAPPAPEPDEGREKSVRRTIPSQILRFRASERAVHWAIAVPFLVCYTTATILVIFYNPDPQRPLRWVFSWTHRLSAICFIVRPPLVVFRSRGDGPSRFLIAKDTVDKMIYNTVRRKGDMSKQVLSYLKGGTNG